VAQWIPASGRERSCRQSVTCPQLQFCMLLPIFTGRSISNFGNKKMRLLMVGEPLFPSWLPVRTER
jgi:hypothetical protein